MLGVHPIQRATPHAPNSTNGLTGFHRQAHASPSGSPNVGRGGGRRGGSAERAGRTNSSSAEGTRAEKRAGKLPKGLKTQLSQLLKVLGMMTIVLEQR